MNSLLLALALASAPTPETRPEVPYFPPAFVLPTVSCGDTAPATRISILDDFAARWYSAHLAAAQEPSLYFASTRKAGPVGAVVRFTWLRSFHAPVFVRVDGLGTSRVRLVAKQLSGKGGYAPGSITKSLVRRLTPDENRSVQSALMRTGVLSMPSRNCDIGVDGAQWIIEAVNRKGYHFVDRQSPTSGGDYEMGLVLLRLTGWQFQPVY